MRQQTQASDPDTIVATKGYVDTRVEDFSGGLSIEEVIDALIDCDADYGLCFDKNVNI